MFRGFITALRTLTIAPVPGKDAQRLASALPWFPAVGLLLGSLLYGLAVLMDIVLPCKWPELVAMVMLLAGMLMTHGLHLDGLSDSADGLFGTRDRIKALEVMKDPRVGAFGAMALVTVLLTKWLCFVRLIELGSVEWVVTAYVISRLMQVILASSQPYARAAGTGEPFVSGARFIHVGAACIVAVLILVAACRTNIQWIPALLASWCVTHLLGMWCRKRIGGVTGDVLGAGSEIVESLVLIMGALMA